MQTKTLTLLLLGMSMSWAMTSCSKDNVIAPEQTQEEKLPEETPDTLQKIAIQQTAEGYAPVVEPISADTFFHYFSKGGWGLSGGHVYHVLFDGTVTKWDLIGGHAQILFQTSETTLHHFGVGISTSGALGYDVCECPFRYNENDNTLTIHFPGYDERDIPFDEVYTIISISDKDMHCTSKRIEVNYEMIWGDTEPYALEYHMFSHDPTITMQDFVNNFNK